MLNKLKSLDLQDCLLLGGFICLETGVGLLSVPVALILVGILAFGCAYLIERTWAIEAAQPAKGTK